MLRRHDVLEIAGLTPSAFTQLANRNVLPFSSKGRQAAGQYLVTELIQLVLFRAIVDAGCAQVIAGDAVRRSFNDFDSFAADRASSSITSFSYGVASLGAPDQMIWAPVFGAWTAKNQKLELEIPGRPEGAAASSRALILVDASRVLSDLQQAARRAGRSGQELDRWVEHFKGRSDG